MKIRNCAQVAVSNGQYVEAFPKLLPPSFQSQNSPGRVCIPSRWRIPLDWNGEAETCSSMAVPLCAKWALWRCGLCGSTRRSWPQPDWVTCSIDVVLVPHREPVRCILTEKKKKRRVEDAEKLAPALHQNCCSQSWKRWWREGRLKEIYPRFDKIGTKFEVTFYRQPSNGNCINLLKVDYFERKADAFCLPWFPSALLQMFPEDWEGHKKSRSCQFWHLSLVLASEFNLTVVFLKKIVDQFIDLFPLRFVFVSSIKKKKNGGMFLDVVKRENPGSSCAGGLCRGVCAKPGFFSSPHTKTHLNLVR